MKKNNDTNDNTKKSLKNDVKQSTFHWLEEFWYIHLRKHNPVMVKKLYFVMSFG